MASAAMRLRPPDRQMKNNSVSLLAPAASSTSLRRSGNAASMRVSGDVCHSTVRTRFPISERSGNPTNAHSARVRTSISSEAGSSLRRDQTSSTDTSSMWTISIDSTFAPPQTRDRLTIRLDAVRYTQFGQAEETTSGLLDRPSRKIRNTTRNVDETRYEILYKTWRLSPAEPARIPLAQLKQGDRQDRS